MRPKFSVLMADYDRHVPRDLIQRGLLSVAWQTCRDFELLICHDGPKQIAYWEEVNFAMLGIADKVRTFSLPERSGTKGHACRNYLMTQARGEWFVHLNIDNIAYPTCLESLAHFIGTISERIVVFTIWHRKNDYPDYRGVPKAGHIDLLQLVAHRDVWQDFRFEGPDENADSITYENMCLRHPYASLHERLGENF